MLNRSDITIMIIRRDERGREGLSLVLMVRSCDVGGDPSPPGWAGGGGSPSPPGWAGMVVDHHLLDGLVAAGRSSRSHMFPRPPSASK